VLERGGGVEREREKLYFRERGKGGEREKMGVCDVHIYSNPIRSTHSHKNICMCSSFELETARESKGEVVYTYRERWGAGVEYHFQEISCNLRPVVNGT